MILSGEVLFNGSPHYLSMCQTQKTITYHLYSPYCEEDRLRVYQGAKPLYGTLNSELLIKRSNAINFLESSVKVEKTSDKVSYYKYNPLLFSIIDLIGKARNYAFAKSNIQVRESKINSEGLEEKMFIAEDSSMVFEYKKVNNYFTSIYIEYMGQKISLSTIGKLPSELHLEYELLDKVGAVPVVLSSIDGVDMDTLRGLLDLSWYEYRPGECKKDYKAIYTKEAFDAMIEELKQAILEAHQKGEKLNLSVDTETNGLNICFLPDDHPLKHRVCAIPISWKKDFGRVIFVDMEYFDNLPVAYVFDTLRPFMCRKEFHGSTVRYMYEDDEKFAKVNAEKDPSVLNDYVYRDTINLVGHNAMFDAKVFYDNNVRSYWDDDTLQMAFNLDPGFGKGSRKLKMLTRKFFGHETPELSDILGKGHEDKYRWLKDLEVATLYGCADADYTLQVFDKLRSLTTDRMYKMYKLQDIRLENILYISEYYGLKMDAEKVAERAKVVKADLDTLHNMSMEYVQQAIHYKNRIFLINNLYNLKRINEKDVNFIKHHIPQVSDVNLYLKGIKEAHAIYGETIPDEIYLDLLEQQPDTPKQLFEFEMSGDSIRRVFYEILEYPVIKNDRAKSKSKKLSIDKFVIKKLMKVKVKKDTNDLDNAKRLLKDIPSQANPNKPLIDAEKFNELAYPMAYVMKVYAELYKEYTSYYKPIEENNMNGRIFKGYSTARIATRRISNPMQTMKGDLKALNIPFGKNWYNMGFDMAQVEYRIMVSLAYIWAKKEFEDIKIEMIDILKSSERDFHTEMASVLHNIEPYLIDKALRKACKSINFGIPYGLGDDSMCEQLFSKVTEELRAETRKLLLKFRTKNKEVISFLDYNRAEALKEWTISDDMRDFLDAYVKDEEKNYVLDEQGNRIPIPVGRVTNALGFYRIFTLDHMDNSKRGSIKRQAGNYPIQSFAAELFRKVIVGFHKGCVKAGIQDKVAWGMLIHDELQTSVHKSVNIGLIYKIIMENCMVKLKDHTHYFVGVGIGNSWYEAKSDKSEAPVKFVKEMVKRYEAGQLSDEEFQADPGGFVAKYKMDYFHRRIHTVIQSIYPTIDEGVIDLQAVLDEFRNYTVRSYIYDYYKPNCNYVDSDTEFFAKFQSWLLAFYGEGRILSYKGEELVVNRNEGVFGDVSKSQEVKEVSFEDDDDELVEDLDYWSFDGNVAELEDVFYGDYQEDVFDSTETEEVQFESTANRDTFSNGIELIKINKPREFVTSTFSAININIKRSLYVEPIKKRLKDHASTEGRPILFNINGKVQKWIGVNLTLDQIDDIVKEVVHGTLKKTVKSGSRRG